MIFSSTLFLFIFLPVTLLVYYLIPAKHLKIRNIALLCASLIFYAWGEPKNIILMLASIACNYIFGLLIGKFAESSGKRAGCLSPRSCSTLACSDISSIGISLLSASFGGCAADRYQLLHLPDNVVCYRRVSRRGCRSAQPV